MELKEFFCKCCTAPLDPGKAVGRVIRCEHCGTYFTMAKESEPKVQNFLNQAEHDLDTCNFEGAYAAYQKAAELDKEEPEAYFGMALAKFKVQYLKDETSDPPRLQPICHEISEKSFSADKHYLRALELASKEQKRVYREKASEIDEIRDQFNELKEDGVKYDCFLCVKVSDENGGTTQDSHEALRLYHHLKERGFHPFYSEEEIGSRTGSDYEALILYALYTSECMLLVCYNEEYLQTKWVKNEYTRFMAMIANEDKERDAITFVFKGKPIERLPGKSGKIQGIDLSRPDAYTRIDNFVESHTPEARARRDAAKRKQREEEEARNLQFEEMRRKLEESERRERQRREEAEAQQKREEASRLAAEKRAKEDEEKRRAEEEARNKELAEMRAALEELRRSGASAQPQAEQPVKAKPKTTRQAPAAPDAGIPMGNMTQEQILAMMREAQQQLQREQDSPIRDGVFVKYTGNDMKVEIPEGVVEIGKGVFKDNKKIMEIKFPKSLKKIGAHAFENCENLERVDIADLKAWCEIEIEYGPNPLFYANYLFLNGKPIHNLVIPAGVTKIASLVFDKCLGLESVIIPAGVTKIESCAFRSCSRLKSVIIPDSVTEIGYSAFDGCSGLTSITIPNGVTKIGDFAFDGCSRLKSITIPDSVTEIGRNAFYGCNWLERVELGNGVKKIGMKAFDCCPALKRLILPDSVVEIGGKFFNESGLTYLEVPSAIGAALNALQRQGEFNSNAISKFVLRKTPAEIEEERRKKEEEAKKKEAERRKRLAAEKQKAEAEKRAQEEAERKRLEEEKKKAEEEERKRLEEAERRKFKLEKQGTGVKLVKYAGAKKKTTAVEIPDEVTEIGEEAFFGYDEMTEISLPTSLVSIGASAFRGCKKLAEITIPATVKRIGEGAFADCPGLKRVNITDLSAWCKIEFERDDANPLFFAYHIYLNGKEITDLVFPEDFTKIGAYVFARGKGLRSVKIPKNVTSIGRGAFWDCDQLKCIEIPDSVTSIGLFAFEGCNGLIRIKIPAAVSEMDPSAFYWCLNLQAIEVSDGNRYFSSQDGVLYDKEKTKIMLVPYKLGGAITIPAGITTIPPRKPTNTSRSTSDNFAGRSALKSVTISSGVQRIEQEAFRDCKALTDVVFPDTLKGIGARAFYECVSLEKISIPNGTTKIGDNAFRYCKALKEVTIPNSVAYFSTGMFSPFVDCPNLQTVTMPKHLAGFMKSKLKQYFNEGTIKNIKFIFT